MDLTLDQQGDQCDWSNGTGPDVKVYINAVLSEFSDFVISLDIW